MSEEFSVEEVTVCQALCSARACPSGDEQETGTNWLYTVLGFTVYKKSGIVQRKKGK